MATQMLTEVKINNVDVASYRRNWLVDESFGDVVRECKIELSTGVSGILSASAGQTITIKRGLTTTTDQFVFDGYVDKVSQSGTTFTLLGKDKMIDLVRKNVTYSYNGASFPSTESKGSDIAEDLIETWGGLTATVVDTGTTNVLDKFICSGTDVLSRLQVLANIYDYQIYYDSDDSTVHFEPKGYNANAIALQVGGASTNVKEIPKWIDDNTQCINKVTIKGAVQEVQDEEYFDGDGSANQVFTIAKKPKIIQCWEDVAGTFVLKVAGVIDSTAGTFDFTTDKEVKEITTTTNWSPAVGSSNVKVVYTNNIPVPIVRQDAASQSLYGVYETEKYFSDIQSVEDAKQRARGLINKYKTPFVNITLKPISLIDYEAGQQVSVIDSFNNRSETLVVTRIVKRWPYNADEVTLGDKELRLSDWGTFTMERIRRLEEEYQRDTDFVVQTYEFNEPIDPNVRYVKAMSSGLSGSGFILGHPQLDVLGTNTLGTGTVADSAADLLRVVWPDDTYSEDFETTDFEDAGTSNWNTTDKRLEL